MNGKKLKYLRDVKDYKDGLVYTQSGLDRPQSILKNYNKNTQTCEL